MASSIKDLATNIVKLERFDEADGETIEEIRNRQKWENDDEICRGHILNAMCDSLFDVYHLISTAKELWDKVEARYMQEDSSSKKFLVSTFLNFKMIDSRPVMEQFSEVEKMLNRFNQHKLHMDETIVVSSIIDKLPPSWKDFKNDLKHKKEDISLEALANSLRIEEEFRVQEKNNSQVMQELKYKDASSKVHMVESGQTSKFNKGKRANQSKDDQLEKKRRKGKCYHCNKEGHYKFECRLLKKKINKGEAPKEVTQSMVAMITELNMVEEDFSWWVDTGATKHVCKNKEFFKNLKVMNDPNAVVYMGNASTTSILGTGEVDLKFTSGHVVTLTNVLYVPEVRKNLVSGSMLNKFGFKLVFEADKFVLSKTGMFVGKGYFCNGMFKLNVMPINKNKDMSSVVYFIESPFTLWHNRLGHVNYKRIDQMIKLDLLPWIKQDAGKCTRQELSNKIPYCFITESDPKTFDEAINSQDALFWKEAINDEMDSIMANKTWELVDLPLGSKPIDCKWIFKKKMKTNGTIDKFKARLVAKGFTQKHGLDYFDTYSPVARITTIRLLIALASTQKWVIHQMDVKTAFLNGELEEEVYMKQPEGFILSGQEGKINESDKCVYSKYNEGKGVIICLYVDDMLIFGTDLEQVIKTKELLSSKFEMKDIDPKINYVKNYSGSVSQLEYAQVVGSLMYAMTCTRPDIAYALGVLSRYTSNPNKQHWLGITRILRYLEGTKDYSLRYCGYPSVLEGYSDASWITNKDDHSSTSGWIFMFGGGAISWGSKKQTCITDSTMASEFVALASTSKEAEWLRNLLFEIPMWPKPMAPISIHCDSASTLAKAYNEVYNGKSRHIGLRHSIVRSLITSGIITIDFVPSKGNLADPLTKGG
ncbi:uncharacterized protein [Primulina eburnea]|uniref:uncharacterized protein n=1 Tax=Primulina eburnea TaxID=1245227 RepID=UPI003C6C2866